MAARLYATGAVKSKAQAADLAGLSRGYFYVVTSPSNGSPLAKHLVNDMQERIQDKSIDMSVVLRELGRQAVGRLHQLMTGSASEVIQLKAAQDLADRSPDTSKTLKHEVSAISLTGEDVKELAAAMVESAKYKRDYEYAAKGDVVRVDTSEQDMPEHAKALERQITTDEAPNGD